MQVCSPSHVDHRLPLGLPNRISGHIEGGQCAEIFSAMHAQSPMTRIEPGLAAGASAVKTVLRAGLRTQSLGTGLIGAGMVG